MPAFLNHSHRKHTQTVLCRAALVAWLWMELAFGTALARQPLFTGQFSDGVQLSGHITEWHAGGHPRLADRLLFDPSQPIKTLTSQQARERTEPAQYVEMVGGDRLPFARLTPNESSSDNRFDSKWDSVPHLLIETPDHAYALEGSGPLRIRTQWLRRVVWQQVTSAGHQPNTLFYRDGSKLPFRAARIRATSVSLLADERRIDVKLDDVAELHFEAIDPWQAYYEQLALLSPDCYSLLFRVTTFDGLECTLSRQRLEAVEIPGKPTDWYWLTAPAWSLDPLKVTSNQVAEARFHWPQEIALTGMVPESIVQRSVMPHRLHPQPGTSVLGTPLKCANETFGWGIGVPTYSALRFRLPPTAQVFHAAVGIDEAAGDGGCAQAEVYADSTESTPLFRSQLLLGGRQAEATGAIQLRGAKQLVLVAESAHAERPAGADPFEIRDFVNWCEPRLELDRQALIAEVRPKLFEMAPGWIGWKPTSEPSALFEARSHWETDADAAGAFHVELKCGEQRIQLSRTFQIPDDCQHLRIHLSRSAVQEPGDVRIRLSLNGEDVLTGKLPTRPAPGEEEGSNDGVNDDTASFVDVDVSAHQGRAAECQLLLTADEEPAWVRSDGFEFLPQR